jgi:hypothetical protein
MLWPKLLAIPIARGRAVMSETPPGVNGTIIVMGRSGNPWAWTVATVAKATVLREILIQLSNFIYNSFDHNQNAILAWF